MSFRRLPLLGLALLLLAIASATAQAQVTWTPGPPVTIGCGNSEISFNTVLAGYTGGPERFHTIVDAGGLRYMDEDAGTPGAGNGVYVWHIYASSTGGPTTGTFPIPQYTPITIRFELINGVGGPPVTSQTVVIPSCGGAAVTGVPTLSLTGLAILGTILAILGTFALRRGALSGI